MAGRSFIEFVYLYHSHAILRSAGVMEDQPSLLRHAYASGLSVEQFLLPG